MAKHLTAFLMLCLTACTAQRAQVWTDTERKLCAQDRLQLPDDLPQPKWYQQAGVPRTTAEKVIQAHYECSKHLASELEKERLKDRCEFLCQTRIFFGGVGTGFLLSLLRGAP